MKNLLLILLFVLPIALFSASPSCLEGMEVSIVDASGKVLKTGKLNSQGRLTLTGVENANWDIKLTNNKKSITLGIDKATPIMYKTAGKGGKATPIMYKNKLSDIKGGTDLLTSNHEAAHVIQQKGGLRSEASLEETNTSERAEGSINTSRSNIKNQNRNTNNSGNVDDDCDDATIEVKSEDNGRVDIKVTVQK